MLDLLPVICQKIDTGTPVVLATLITRKGSSPRDKGARLVADAAGLIGGTVGGGGAEAAVLKACEQMLKEGTHSKLLEMSFTNKSASIEGMVCGGTVKVFAQTITPSGSLKKFFATIADVTKKEQGVFITEITHENTLSPCYFYSSKGLISSLSNDTTPEFLDEVASWKTLTETKFFTCNGKDYFAEPLLLPCQLIIAGGGHVAVPTAELAAYAGFSVHIIDDREDFSQQERFPWADTVTTTPGYVDCLTSFSPHSNTYIIIVTRGHLHDGTVLEQALKTKAGYIGMIGSLTKRGIIYESILEKGFTENDIAKVHCPIGLDISAETPNEIAFSIISECIAYRNGTSKKRADLLSKKKYTPKKS